MYYTDMYYTGFNQFLFSDYRMTILFFAVSGLDVLGALHELENEKDAIIKWIYSLQISPDDNGECIDSWCIIYHLRLP